ncbi:PREDICTED: uncharacterized protein LOC105361011 [Ceratosolen solmsi marchali]|uniref:Uncharacterized protein LOC105361011 n=1 Tax=Ceratosolen solmsi marchali TaxID=326594 RepID=A0AAJ7DTX2_9HYME|nr:PREDICTED: uncharacterized protein LOC105361011 [Ceratosolen solmsi marchali]
MRKVLAIVLIYGGLFMSAYVAAYSRVSKNGQARGSIEDIVFTVSPVYADTPASIDLKSGEVINHPSTSKYSTIDEELLAKLEGLEGRNRPQKRFHPPASFEHTLAHSNSLRQQSASSELINTSSNDNVIYQKPVVSMTYDYPSNINTKLKLVANKPLGSTNAFSMQSPPKFSDTYFSGTNNNPSSTDQSEYHKLPNFDFDHPPKSVKFLKHYDHPYEDIPTYVEHPYDDQVVYDHISDDHYFHHQHNYPVSSTQEPEIMDQRVNKRPYSYYYIGKKLWYIPLYFSIYFIIYVAALVLKSVARHRINFPTNIAAAGDNARSANWSNQNSPVWMNYVTKVLESIEKYGKVS